MKKRSKTRRNVEAVIWYIVMGILAILFVLPFIWMLSTAFKTGPQCVDYPPTFIPRPFSLRAFKEVFEISPIFKYIQNSLVIVGLNIFGTLLIAPCGLMVFPDLTVKKKISGSPFFFRR